MCECVTFDTERRLFYVLQRKPEGRAGPCSLGQVLYFHLLVFSSIRSTKECAADATGGAFELLSVPVTV